MNSSVKQVTSAVLSAMSSGKKKVAKKESGATPVKGKDVINQALQGLSFSRRSTTTICAYKALSSHPMPQE